MQSNQDRRRRIIKVEKIVMDGLVMPDPLARSRVQGQYAICIQISAYTKTSIVIFGSRAGSRECPPSLFINRNSTPRICAPVCFPFYPLPRLVARLPLERDRMKYPFKLTGHSIIGPNMAGRRTI